jgi:nucleotide-binding universal stress UspA family protein
VFHSILVPLDGSTLAEQAVPIAASLAEHNHVPLSLAIVHPWGPDEDAPRPGSRTDREFREDEGVYLNRLMQTVASTYHIPVCEAVLDGPATGPTLVKYARERNIDLVVASTHEHGVLGHLLSTGVARQLAHGGRASVLLIKPQVGPLPISLGGFRRVLVALDGSPEAEVSLDPAAALASEEGRLILVGIVSGKGDLAEQHRADAESYFEALLERSRRYKCALEVAVLVGENPAGAIVEYGRRAGCDLIALTTRPRGSAARTLFGSTADAVLRKAAVPVLVCHADRTNGHSVLS